MQRSDAGRSIEIRAESDLILARQSCRELAGDLGFSRPDQALIATATSELTRNILRYAIRGVIHARCLMHHGRLGIEIIAKDDGPGIVDVEAAMEDGFSTGKSLGLGLPGTKRIMDEFAINTAPGKGVEVRATKWRE